MFAWRDDDAGLVRGFTDRNDGVSGAPFAGLNLGAHVGDDPAAVATNRARLEAELGLTTVWADQVHGSDVIHVTAEVLDAQRSETGAVGTGDAMNQAIACARPGAMVGFVGVPHGVELPIGQMFARNVGVRGGMATVRTYLPDLMERVWSGRIDPGLVFDLTLGLEDAAEGYRAMDQRRAIKALLRP